MNKDLHIKLSGAETTVLRIGAVEVDPDLASDVRAVGNLLTREVAGRPSGFSRV